MSLIYFKINEDSVVTEAEYFYSDTTEKSNFPAAKFFTDGNKPLAEEDYETIPANTWIDTDTILLQQRSSPVIDNINGCVYNREDKTFG